MFPEWIKPLFGGALISFSLSVFILINRTNYGVGGMLKNAIERNPSISWNNDILFLIGLILSPLPFTKLFYPITGIPIQSQPLLIIISGLLVGIGYQLSSGGLITRAVLAGYKNFKFSLIVVSLFLLFGGISQFFLIFNGVK